MDAVTNRTPCGRIPNMPLRNARHEAVAHAFVQGMTCREAGLAAGYRDGPGLKGNISRLCAKPDMRERIAELAAIAGEKAEIDDAWILSLIKQLADSSLANFLLFDADGKLVLDALGHPVIDLSRATPEQLRTLANLEYHHSGRFSLRLRDPVRYLKLLARNRGLLRDKLAPTDASGEGTAQVYVISDRPMSEEDWKGSSSALSVSTAARAASSSSCASSFWGFPPAPLGAREGLAVAGCPPPQIIPHGATAR